MAHDVFISHSSIDKAIADAVCSALEAEGIRCWIAPRDIQHGTDWSEAIVKAIKASQVMMLVFSSNANRSPQVRREVQRAFENGVTVIPVRVEDILPHEALEYYISSVHWFNALPLPIDSHLPRLVETHRMLPDTRERVDDDQIAERSTETLEQAPPLAHAHNLPRQMTSFIGRERQLAEVKALLEQSALLTLTAPGGSGKTRLALQVAEEALAYYPDGVWLVELASLSDPALVAQAVASVLDVREEPGRPLLQTLIDYLKPRALLLVLDNCEHLLSACASLADTLVKCCPKLCIVATSREGLGISGERTYRVPPLALPDPKHLPALETLTQYEAVRLFIERALFIQPGFAVNERNAPAVAQICHRLDGIPLAIELAAVRVKSMPVEQIMARLDDRFRLLTGGSRAALPRQQTLRSLIDWSYDLLSEAEKGLLGRLSVFAGGWTLEAAEAIGAGEGIEEWEVLDLLTALVDKSLVVYKESQGQARYRLLETIRQYCREKLKASQDEQAVQERHLAFFLKLAQEAEAQLQGPEQLEWLERLEQEHDNLRVALEWSKASATGAEAGLQLAGALARFWSVRGYVREGREWLRQMLSRNERASVVRAKALMGAGVLAQFQGEYPAARTLHEQSLAIRRDLGNKQGIADTLTNLGNVVAYQGDYAAAQALHEESLAIRREMDDKQGIATSLTNLGNVAMYQGKYPGARILHEESLAIRRELSNKQGVADSLINLGNIAVHQGDYAAARSLYEQSLAVARDLGNRQSVAVALNNLGFLTELQGDYATARSLYEQSLAIEKELGNAKGVADSLTNLGNVARYQGDYAAARSLYEQSLAIYRDVSDKECIAISLEAFAALASEQEQSERASKLWGAAEGLREDIGAPLPLNERDEYDGKVAAVREALGGEAFTAGWAKGRAMSLEQAIEYALQDENEQA